jgi:hypothetical protein
VKLIQIRTMDDLRHSNNRTSSQTLERSTDDQPTISSTSIDKETLAYQVIFLEAPHKAEKTTKSIIAIYNNGFRPTISDTRPLTGARRVIARVYDFYQLMPSGNVGNSRCRPKSILRGKPLVLRRFGGELLRRSTISFSVQQERRSVSLQSYPKQLGRASNRFLLVSFIDWISRYLRRHNQPEIVLWYRIHVYHISYN